METANKPELLPALLKFKTNLETLEKKLKPFGNYEKRVSNNTIEPTPLLLKLLVTFFVHARKVTKALQKFEESQYPISELVDDAHVYTDLRDNIYRLGKYDQGGMNQNLDEKSIKAEYIFLGYPPESLKKPIKWILEKWPLSQTEDRTHAKGYSIEAWNKMRNSLGLIQKIQKFEEAMKA